MGRAEVLAGDKELTTVGFLEHAYTWDAEQGVTIRWLRTDNGATTGATRSADNAFVKSIHAHSSSGILSDMAKEMSVVSNVRPSPDLETGDLGMVSTAATSQSSIPDETSGAVARRQQLADCRPRRPT